VQHLTADASGFANPMTTVGDLILGGAAGAPARLAASTSGFVLTANGVGVAPSWQASAAGFVNPMTTVGDLIVGGTSGAATRVAAAAIGLCFMSNGVGVAPSYQACPSGGGGGVSLSPSATQTILAANTSTTPLIIDTPASPTVDAFIVKSGGTPAIRVDKFAIVQFDTGVLNSASGINFSSGGDFGIAVNKNGTGSNFNVSSGWAGSAITGDIVAVTSGTHTVADCATSCVDAVGVVVALPNTNNQVAFAPSQVTVNLDATYSPVGGWFACSSATTAGKAIVQSAACAQGRQVGYVTAAGISVTAATIVLQFK
jgi:hypothetical protein